jgi:uncharacterized repeat protein (TIGR01451 family)
MFKFSTGARAIALRVLAAGAAIQLLCGHGCVPPPTPQREASLTLAVTQPGGTYRPGDTVAWRITVTNPGPVDVNDFTIFSYLDYNLLKSTATCTLAGPAVQASSSEACSSMRTMGVGATVTIDVVALVRSAELTSAANFVRVDVAGGPGYRVTNTVALANLPGAGYRVFTAAGRRLDASIDAMASTITFDGAGGRTLPYTGPDADGTWQLAGGAGWRETPDLLVGTADLGDGTQPFVAARSFITTPDGLDGREFSMFEREILADGNTVTRVHAASMLGTAMKVCVSAQAYSLAKCPPASLHNYYLRATEGAFQATDGEHSEYLLFRVARVGDTQVLLRAEPAGTGRIFAIGLQAVAGPVAATLAGGDTLGRWGTLGLAAGGATLLETLQASGGAPVTLAGSLTVAPSAPAGLLESSLGSPAAAVWLVQEGPLAVVAGKPGTPIDGLIQVFSR